MKKRRTVAETNRQPYFDLGGQRLPIPRNRTVAVEEARKRPFLVETSRVRVIIWLVWGILGTIVPLCFLFAEGHTTWSRVACLALVVMVGILPLLVVLENWPIGKAVIRMTESHLEVPEGNFSWDEIRSVEIINRYSRRDACSIAFMLVDGSIRRIEDGLYTRSLPDVYGEICKRIEDTDPEIRRNDPCPCGSRRKYKKCCGRP